MGSLTTRPGDLLNPPLLNPVAHPARWFHPVNFWVGVDDLVMDQVIPPEPQVSMAQPPLVEIEAQDGRRPGLVSPVQGRLLFCSGRDWPEAHFPQLETNGASDFGLLVVQNSLAPVFLQFLRARPVGIPLFQLWTAYEEVGVLGGNGERLGALGWLHDGVEEQLSRL